MFHVDSRKNLLYCVRLFFFNHEGAYVYLQLNLTGTLLLMLVNGFYYQILPL